MKNIDKIGLTWIGFFSYAFTGALVVVTGIIIGNISDYFHLSVSKMSNIFTFLNAGILIALLVNSWLIKAISLKKQLIFGFILTVIALIGIIFSHSIFFFSINMFILGFVSGVTMSIGTFLITYLYSGSKRSSKLLLTDSFFSMSGMIFPILSAYFLEKKIIWHWTYISIGVIYLLILILSVKSNFPKLQTCTETQETVQENLNFNIILLSISALFYILGQLGFISWIPQYTTTIMNIDIKKASNLVSNFWMSYMIGMWFFSFIIKFFDLYRIFIFLTGTSTILMYFFIHIYDYIFLQYIIISLGFFSSAIYTIIITIASLQTRNPSPKLINLILLFGTMGTLLTFIITSLIIEKKGLYMSLLSSNILYGIVFILSILVYINKKYIKTNI